MGSTKHVATLCAAVLAVVGVAALSSPAGAAHEVVPLPADLEAIRAAEATTVYGSPEIRPMDQRRTSVISLGDSEISGEGAYDLSLYEPGTNGPVDYCHRSVKAAIKVVDIPVDLKVNHACSGGRNENLKFQGPGTYQKSDNQGDKLAITARNTKVKMIWLVMSANDHGGIEFGPLMTKCSENRVFFKGTCWQSESGNEAARFTVVRNGLKGGIADVRAIMRDAGYAESEYQLNVSSYPSPVSPDVEDNPNFPGWYTGGCMLYLADHAAGRNKLVPMFEDAVRDAALSSATRYVDASRLFAGHEPCTEQPWVTGLYNSSGNIFDPHAWRQSWHPNVLGHAAFARCMRDMYNSDAETGTCYDPASTNSSVFRAGLLEFSQVQNPANGLCVDTEGHSSRNGYRLLSFPCHGARNQGWWYDPDNQSIHPQLTHDRCWDVNNSGFAPGAKLQVWNCNGGNAQKWVLDGELVRVKAAPHLCATMPAGTNPVAQALTLRECGTAANQRLGFTTLTGAFHNLTANGMCLDVPGAAPTAGINLLSYSCEFGSADQKWSWNPVARQVINGRSPGYCLDAPASTVGTQVRVVPCQNQVGASDADGRWELDDEGNLYQPRDPSVVATAADINGGPITLQRRDPAKAPTQRWAWNSTQELRIAYSYDLWMPSSVY